MANKELFNYMKVLQRNEKKGGDIYAEVKEKKKKGKKQKYASDKSIYEVTLTNYILHLYQLIFNWLLKWLSATVISMSILGETVGTCLLGYVLLGEVITMQQFIGIVGILCGIGIFLYQKDK